MDVSACDDLCGDATKDKDEDEDDSAGTETKDTTSDTAERCSSSSSNISMGGARTTSIVLCAFACVLGVLAFGEEREGGKEGTARRYRE